MVDTVESLGDNQLGGGLSDEQAADLDALMPDFEPPADITANAEQQGSGSAETVEMVGMMLGGVFMVLASRMGEHWALSDGESQAIAGPLVKVMDKYMPNFESSPEMALIVTAGVVLAPRVMKQQAINAEVEKGGDKPESSTK